MFTIILLYTYFSKKSISYFTISEFNDYFIHEIIFTNSERNITMPFLSDAELYYTIGTNIKYYREQAHLTQIQLADKVQISLSYLSKIESTKCHKSISISILNQIANNLDIPITEFFKEVH